MGTKGLLILEYDNLARATEGFYERLNSSPAFQQAFLDDPMGILRRSIFPNAPLPPEGVLNKGNRLLYALLSNANFMSWANEFQASMENEVQQAMRQTDDRNEAIKSLLVSFDKNRMYSEIVDGILNSIDKETLYSLVIGTNLNDTLSSLRVRSTEYVYTNEYVASELYVAAYLVAVLAIVITQFDATPIVEPQGINREDLQRISGSLTSSLREKAVQIRESGALSSVDSVDQGASL
jgi:hypothetical protein